jgi:hypothetical protein
MHTYVQTAPPRNPRLRAHRYNSIPAVAPCPVNAVNGPACVCASGYAGRPLWNATSQTWSGSCTRMPCLPCAAAASESAARCPSRMPPSSRSRPVPHVRRQCAELHLRDRDRRQPDLRGQHMVGGLHRRRMPAECRRRAVVRLQRGLRRGAVVDRLGVVRHLRPYVVVGWGPEHVRPMLCQSRSGGGGRGARCVLSDAMNLPNAVAPCPANAVNAPSCSCAAGYIGNLTFSNGAWSGQCTRMLHRACSWTPRGKDSP